MTDLSQRIMDAWLERNPEPDDGDRVVWCMAGARLEAMLRIGAYESAVVQFLVPEAWGYQLSAATPKAIQSGLLRIDTPHCGRIWDSCGTDMIRAGVTAPEALLTAILAAEI